MCVQTGHADAAERSAHVLPPAAAQTLDLPPPPLRYPPPPPQPRHTAPPVVAPHPSATQAPPVHSNHQHHLDASSMQTSGPVQQINKNRKSRWDVPPAAVEGQWNTQSNRQQPEQHAARSSMPSRDASPEQLTQHLQSLSLQPPSHAGNPYLSLMMPSRFSILLGNDITQLLCRYQHKQTPGRQPASSYEIKPTCKSGCCSHSSGLSCLTVVTSSLSHYAIRGIHTPLTLLAILMDTLCMYLVHGLTLSKTSCILM